MPAVLSVAGWSSPRMRWLRLKAVALKAAGPADSLTQVPQNRAERRGRAEGLGRHFAAGSGGGGPRCR